VVPRRFFAALDIQGRRLFFENNLENKQASANFGTSFSF
jgi:hypothetical protein